MMTEEEAESLVYDLIDAVRDLEHAMSYNNRHYSQEYEAARKKVMAALIAGCRKGKADD